jgi:SAM-dependent methyltransferase
MTATGEIRFDDGAAYERYMGKWSQQVGEAFLAWLAPPPGWRWLDVGCGNGAFTQLLIDSCQPASVSGVDPSEAQIAFARERFTSSGAQFQVGDAMALPFPSNSFDAAVMPLVIFFVPEPAQGVAEMARVVCPGGSVSAYAWDMEGGGFPYAGLQEEMRGMGIDVPTPPRNDASKIEVLRDLWRGAGLSDVETRSITVQRTFESFADYWETVLGGPSVGKQLAAMTPPTRERLEAAMRQHLPADAQGRITYGARANAIKGRVPA